MDDVLMVSVNVDRDDLELYQRWGERWLRRFPEVMAPDLWDRIRVDPLVSAGLSVIPWPDGPIKGGKFDLTRFDHFVGKLADPVESIRCGGETDDERVGTHVSWTRERHMYFGGDVSVTSESLPGDVRRLVGFMVDFLDDIDPAFGAASIEFKNNMDTELDRALRRDEDDSIAQSREFLRGYSWLTVIPKELVARLGGVRALREAPLAAVYPLTAGGVVVLASSTPSGYDDVAMRGLFRTVSPVLPPGKPKPQPGYDNLRVVYEEPSRT